MSFVPKIVLIYSSCAFSSNLYHGQIAQIYIDHLSGHENKKCSPWKVVAPTILKPLYLWAGEALDARTRGCLHITLAQKWHSGIFQISAEKVSQPDEIIVLHSLNQSSGFATWILQIKNPKNYIKKKSAGAFCQAEELFSAKIWNISKCQYWAM